MELLPDSISQFREKSYWNRFFTKRENRSFDWLVRSLCPREKSFRYGEFSDIKACVKDCLDDIVKRRQHFFDNVPNLKILNLGNGNSRLPIDIYQELG